MHDMCYFRNNIVMSILVIVKIMIMQLKTLEKLVREIAI